jgi:hypothetical protein
MDNQSTLERSFLEKKSVCIINLLALLGENKDINNIVESNLSINLINYKFDQLLVYK